MTINWEELLHDDYPTVKDMIHGHNHVEDMPLDEISKHLGVSTSVLKTKIKELQVPIKKRYGRRKHYID